MIIKKEWNDILCVYCTSFLSPAARKRKTALVEESAVALIDGWVCDPKGLAGLHSNYQVANPLGEPG